MPKKSKKSPSVSSCEDDDGFIAQDEEEFDEEGGDYDWYDDDDEEEENEDDEDIENDDANANHKRNKKNKKHSNKHQQQEDLYLLLQVDNKATKEQITKQYRLLSLKCHPDRNPGDPEATKKFQQLCSAYEVLNDEKRRKIYDRTGETDEQAAKYASGGGDGDFDNIDAARSYEIGEMLKTFMSVFRESDEEVEDLKKAFILGHGNLAKVLDNFMWQNEEGELERIVAVVNDKIIISSSSSSKSKHNNNEYDQEEDNENVNDDDDDDDDANSIQKYSSNWKTSASIEKVKSLKKKLDKERIQAEKMLAEFLNNANYNNNNQNQNQNSSSNRKQTTKAIMPGKKHNTTASSSAASKNDDTPTKFSKKQNQNENENENENKNNNTKKEKKPKQQKENQLMALPSLMSMRENAKNNFSSSIDDLAKRWGVVESSGKSKKAKKEKK